ncbi:Predicted arabinose efflux permease, MFS family [Agrococcus baldri]|uniref:Predicted arabinose efflux permease, MFS family n=1 Tax=Agrococcus baldri TaxID=153730 RepID=A0AA94HND5_9MICO|nr:MFS transporter [Agrococcus baldri]SFS14839.1 Predicted arabinose efflux permease, MFS family [Agrococcus baldri]
MSHSTTHLATGRERNKVLAAVVVGTTIEWYDFFIYAFMANLVFAQLFFEPAGPGLGQIFSLLTIGISFLFRPLGAFLAGHFGDKLGRRPMLVITLLLMGGATTLVGALPTFDTIGVMAPVLLILLRILQGLSAGGEWGGAVLMAIEHAPANRRGLYGSFVQAGVPIGMLLATGILAAIRAMFPGDSFLEFGWRIPFFISIILVIVGFVVRRSVDESPVFKEIKETAQESSAPIKIVFKKYGHIVLFAAMVFMANNATGYMTTGGYVQGLASRPVDGTPPGLGFDPVGVQLAAFAGSLSWLVFTFVAGWLSDRIGRKPLYFIGWATLAAGILPLFVLVEQGVAGVAWATIILGAGLGLTYGAQAAFYAESFPASVRYSGVSIAYAIGAVIGGAFAPTIAQALLNATGTTWVIVSYLLTTVIISVIGTALMPDRTGVPLSVEYEHSGHWEKFRRGDEFEELSPVDAQAHQQR